MYRVSWSGVTGGRTCRVRATRTFQVSGSPLVRRFQPPSWRSSISTVIICHRGSTGGSPTGRKGSTAASSDSRPSWISFSTVTAVIAFDTLASMKRVCGCTRSPAATSASP